MPTVKLWPARTVCSNDMEPLHPNDPMWKLLGNAREAGPRPNFTQNVVRKARQTPQARGWWQGLKEWIQDHPAACPRMALAGAAAILLVCVIIWPFDGRETAPVVVDAPVRTVPANADQTAAIEESPLVADVETQWENMDRIDALLAIEDTSTFSDSEIMFLLY